ncbi:MAG: hypothetical protein U0359_06325 [Byssovorax sp.]
MALRIDRITLLAACMIAGAVTLSPRPAAAADDEALPIDLFKQGRSLVEQGKYAEACPKFAESLRLKELTGTALNLADCYKHIGKTASAWALFGRTAFLAKKQNDSAREQLAQQEAAALEPKLSRLQINADATPGLVIHRDNDEVGKGALGVPIAVDPGQHVIEATAPGYAVWSTTIVVGAEKDSKVVTIPLLQKAPDAKVDLKGGPKSSGTLRTVSYAVGGVGLAGLVVGGVFGGLAAADKGKLGTDCPNNICSTQAGQDELASAKSKALISTIGLAAGGALAATGVVLFLVSSPKSSDAAPKAALVPLAGPEGGGFLLRGSF